MNRLEGKVAVITEASSGFGRGTARAFAESVPLKRWGEVEDIAQLAVFLASDESSYIHGDLIRVDGGETLCRYSV